MKKWFFTLSLIALFLLPSLTRAERLVFLVIDTDSYLVNKAVAGLELPQNLTVKYFTYANNEIIENVAVTSYELRESLRSKEIQISKIAGYV